MGEILENGGCLLGVVVGLVGGAAAAAWFFVYYVPSTF